MYDLFIKFPISYCYFISLKLPVMFDVLQDNTIAFIPFFFEKSRGSFILLNRYSFPDSTTFENIVSAADDLVKNGYLINCSFSYN